MAKKVDLNEWFKHNILLSNNPIININGEFVDKVFSKVDNTSVIDSKVKNVNMMKDNILHLIKDSLNDETKKENLYVFLKKLDILVNDYNLVNIPAKNKTNTVREFETQEEAQEHGYRVLSTNYGKYVYEIPRDENIKTNISHRDSGAIPKSYQKNRPRDILGQNVFDLMFKNDLNSKMKVDDIETRLTKGGLDIEPIHLENIMTVLSNIDMDELNRIYNSDINEFTNIRKEYVRKAQSMQDSYIKEVMKLHSHKIGMLGEYSMNGKYLGSQNIAFEIFSDICRYGIKGAVFGNIIGLGRDMSNLTLSQPIALVNLGKNIYKKVSIRHPLGYNRYKISATRLNSNVNIDEWSDYFRQAEIGRLQTTKNSLNLAKIKEFDTFTKYRVMNSRKYSKIITRYIKSTNIPVDKLFENRHKIIEDCVRKDGSFNRLINEINGEENLNKFENVIISENIIVPRINKYLRTKTRNDIVFIPMLNKNSKFYGMYIPINRKDDSIAVNDLNAVYSKILGKDEVEKFIEDSKKDITTNKYYKNYSHNTIITGSIPIMYANMKYNIGENEDVSYKDFSDKVRYNIRELGEKLNFSISERNKNILKDDTNNNTDDTKLEILSIDGEIQDIDEILSGIENSVYTNDKFEFQDSTIESAYIYIKEKINESNVSNEEKSIKLEYLDKVIQDEYINTTEPIFERFDDLKTLDGYIKDGSVNPESDMLTYVNFTIDGNIVDLTLEEIELLDNLKDKLIDTTNMDEVRNILKPYINDQDLNIGNMLNYLEIEKNSNIFNLKNLKRNTLFPNIPSKQLEFLESDSFTDVLRFEFDRGVVPKYEDIDDFLNISGFIDNNLEFDNFVRVKYEIYKSNITNEISDSTYMSSKDLTIKNVLDELNSRLVTISSFDGENNKTLINIKKDALEKIMRIAPLGTQDDRNSFMVIGQQVIDNLVNSFFNHKNIKDTNESILNDKFKSVNNREFTDIELVHDNLSSDDTSIINGILNFYIEDVSNIKESRFSIREKDDWKFEYLITLTALDGSIKEIPGEFDIYPKHDKPLTRVDIDDMNRLRAYILRYKDLKPKTKEFLLETILGQHLNKDGKFVDSFKDIKGLESEVNKSLKLDPNEKRTNFITYIKTKINDIEDNDIVTSLKLAGITNRQLIQAISNKLRDNNMKLNKENIDIVFNNIIEELREPIKSIPIDSIKEQLDKVREQGLDFRTDNYSVNMSILSTLAKTLDNVFKTLNIENKFDIIIKELESRKINLDNMSTSQIKDKLEDIISDIDTKEDDIKSKIFKKYGKDTKGKIFDEQGNEIIGKISDEKGKNIKEELLHKTVKGKIFDKDGKEIKYNIFDGDGKKIRDNISKRETIESKTKNKLKLNIVNKKQGFERIDSKTANILRILNNYIINKAKLKNIHNLNKNKMWNKFNVNMPIFNKKNYEKEVSQKVLDINELNKSVNIMRNTEIDNTKNIQRTSYENIISQKLVKTNEDILERAKQEREAISREIDEEKETLEDIRLLQKEIKKTDRELEEFIAHDKHRRILNENFEDDNDIKKNKVKDKEIDINSETITDLIKDGTGINIQL